jgi:hypothetical protein
MSIQVNGLKVLYRDVRINTGGLDEEDGTITCHGPNIASYDGYLKNSTKVMTRVLTEEDGTFKSTSIFSARVCPTDHLSFKKKFYLFLFNFFCS